MSRRDMHKAVRLCAGVYLVLQVRPADVLAELYCDALHDREPVLFACSAVDEAGDVTVVDDGTGLAFGPLHIVMPEAAASELHAWVLDRLPALEVA